MSPKLSSVIVARALDRDGSFVRMTQREGGAMTRNIGNESHCVMAARGLGLPQGLSEGLISEHVA